MKLTPQLLLLAFITVFGGVLRFTHPQMWPPGLENDEGLQGMDAFNALAGHFFIYFKEAYREPLYVYLAMPFIALFGRTELAIRLPAMIAGTATIPLTYLAVKEIFEDSEGQRASWIGVLSAGFCAFSLWPVIMSRTAIPGTVLPPLMTAAFWLLWRAWRTGNGFVPAGIVLGLVPYTYLPSRLTPIVLGGFLCIDAIVRRSDSFLAMRRAGTLKAIAAALLVFAPLGLYYVSDPSAFIGRASHVSIFRPDVPEGSPLPAAVRTTGQAVAAFFTAGDSNWYHNLSGRPIFDVFTALFAGLGILLCLARAKRRPEMFILLWTAVMLLPGILSDDNNPNTARLVGLIPVAFVYPGIGLQWISGVLASQSKGGWRVAAATCVLLLLYSFTATFSALETWAESKEAFEARSGESIEAVRTMNQRGAEPGAVFLLPISNAWPVARNYQQRSIQFLYSGQNPYVFQRVDDVETAPVLKDVCGGCTRMYVYVWKVGPHIDADPKELMPSLLQRAGLLVFKEEHPGFDLLGYDVPAGAKFALPDQIRPSGNAQNSTVSLESASVEQSWSGRDVVLTGNWRLPAKAQGDVRLSYRVLDSSGEVVAQRDRLLLGNDHLSTLKWEAGQTAQDVGVVSLPPGTLPGEYRVSVVVYGAGPAVTVNAGTVRVDAPRAPYTADDVDVDVESVFQNDDVRLLGVTMAPGPTGTSAARATLYWLAKRTPVSDVSATVRLVGPDGKLAATQTGPAAEGKFSASSWKSGDVIADSRLLPLDGPLSGKGKIEVIVGQTPVLSGEIDLSYNSPR